jgi:L-lysine exporter family protein LysE/ArgO
MNQILTAFKGFAMGAGLIIAIGTQNAFVLRKGIEKRDRLKAALFCSLSDAFLIGCGILGLGSVFERFPLLLRMISIGGSFYLFFFAFNSAKDAYRGNTLISNEKSPSGKTMKILFLITFLNPHLYLDTVVMLGSVGSSTGSPLLFGSGAILASFCWFFALAFGSSILAPLFTKKISWKIMDSVIAVIMCVIGIKLLLFGIHFDM